MTKAKVQIPDHKKHAVHLWDQLDIGPVVPDDLNLIIAALHWSYNEGWRRARQEYERALNELAVAPDTVQDCRFGFAIAADLIRNGEL